MIINHTHGFVFIHIPKAAGTTITRCLTHLTEYRDQEIGGTVDGEARQQHFIRRFGLRKHAPARIVRQKMSESEWSSYFKFSFVRNPFDRLVSSYHFLKAWPQAPKPTREKVAGFETVEDFLASDWWYNTPGPDNMFRPQTFWVYQDGVNLLDFVGQIEDLTAGMRVVDEAVGGGLITVPSKRANQSRPYTSPDWTPKLMTRVRERYAQDFKSFNYPDKPTTLA